MLTELKHLIDISKFAGERFDLIQAGGGNSSVKSDDGTMYVKSSGTHLSEMTENRGHARVNYKNIQIILEDDDLLKFEKVKREKISNEFLKKQNLTPNSRPSIETFLHAITLTYTLHTHPLAVNAISTRVNWNSTFKELFPSSLLVSYDTPGIELSILFKKKMKIYIERYKVKPEIIFLQNHGLIITSDNAEKIYEITNSVVIKLENFLDLDLKKYRIANNISKLVNNFFSLNKIAYLSRDYDLMKLLKKHPNISNYSPTCPDTVVFCGRLPLVIQKLEKKLIENYFSEYNSFPKVIIFKKKIFFISDSIAKAKQIEEVFKFHIITLVSSKDNDINFLNENELKYLSNWEAEKFRQKI